MSDKIITQINYCSHCQVGASADLNMRVVNPSPVDPTVSGKTALGIAKSKKQFEIAKFLASVGAVE